MEGGKWKVEGGKWMWKVDSGCGKWMWKVESGLSGCGCGKWKVDVDCGYGKWRGSGSHTRHRIRTNYRHHS